MKNVALYCRVSTTDQDTDNQLIELRRYVKARGWSSKEFVDQGFSGMKNEDQRPALKKLMKAARKKEISAVVVWDFSRFARSMRQLVDALDNFKAWGIAFISLRESIDTTTANGRLMFGIFASLAEFERELIRERVMLGLNKAKMKGRKLGRPNKQVDLEKLKEMRLRGSSLRQIARKVGISKDTVKRLLEASQNPSQNGYRGINTFL